MNLEDKVVLVVGSTAGIGRATAIKFAEVGARVVVSGRRDDNGEEVVKVIRKNGGEAIFVYVDVTKKQDIELLIKKTVDHFGVLDIAVNNAAYGGTMCSLQEMPQEEIDKLIKTNFLGVVYCLQHELNQMLKQGGGVITNISSSSTFRTEPMMSVYAATKSAVNSLTKVAAIENGKNRIRINAVSPGPVVTEMSEAVFEDENIRQYFESLTATGRIASVNELANAIVWISSDEASNVTGTIFRVDGGMGA